MSLAKDVPDSVLEERMRFLAPNKCCMLIYTVSTKTWDIITRLWHPHPKQMLLSYLDSKYKGFYNLIPQLCIERLLPSTHPHMCTHALKHACATHTHTHASTKCCKLKQWVQRLCYYTLQQNNACLFMQWLCLTCIIGLSKNPHTS